MKYLVMLSVAILASAAQAVVPATWTHATEADFAKAELKNAATTSLGEVILARKIEIIMPSASAPAVVSAVAAGGKAVYAAAGAKPLVFRIEGGKAGKWATLPGAMVCCLRMAGKDLLAGTGGNGAGIYRVSGKDTVKKVWADGKVKYVWAIAPGKKGVLYAATGPEGKVFAVDKAGKGRLIYHADKLAKNILSLAVARNGHLYAGTDTEGLVIQIDPARRKGRVVLDAAEKEIAALAVDGNGGLFAATADAAKAGPDGKVKPNSKKAGKAAGKVRPAPKPAAAKKGPNPAPAASQPAGSATAPAEKAVVLVMPPGPSTKPRVPSKVTPPAPPKGKGNAVYYIRPDGLVHTIFRRPVTILAMVMHKDRLVLGTGNGGSIYAVTPDGDEIVQLADTDAKQVTALAVGGPGGRLVFATANKGSVGLIADAPAAQGTLTCKPLDAKQIAKWGTVRVQGDLPKGTRIGVATRSGNIAKAGDKTWSSWSKEHAVRGDFLAVLSPPGRFLQYRLKLTGAGGVSPAVKQVEIVYQVGNLPPVVSALTAIPVVKVSLKGRAVVAPSKVYRMTKITASDPNGDKLTFTLAFREQGADKWITMTDKLAVPSYVWDTRTIGDGVYELRVTASDKASNTPDSALEAARISQRIVVDNTPPVIKPLAAKTAGKTVSLSGQVTDASSRITSIEYAVDSQNKWLSLLPKDGIADSKREQLAFEVKDLAAGPHRIALRAKDIYGNTGYASASVTIAP